jgi:hypothetical protein
MKINSNKLFPLTSILSPRGEEAILIPSSLWGAEVKLFPRPAGERVRVRGHHESIFVLQKPV